MVRLGTEDYVLVIGVERMSDSTEPTDRSVRFIFGDGAGAVVVGPSDVTGIGPVVWGSDGSQSQAIRQEPDWLAFADDPSQRPWIKMEGTSVFRWAAFEMGKVATQALERAGVAMEDLGAFIPHQANGRINEVIARSIKLPESVPVSDDIAETGNTSAASIPLAMEEVIRTGKAKPGELALLVGFRCRPVVRGPGRHPPAARAGLTPRQTNERRARFPAGPPFVYVSGLRGSRRSSPVRPRRGGDADGRRCAPPARASTNR